MTEATRPETETRFPVRLSTFVGREAECRALHELLDTGRMITLIGPGGCGKTRLATEVATGRAGRFRRMWFADLAPSSEPGQVANAVRAATGAPEQAWRDASETLIDWIGDDDALLVVDNCEHVLDGVAGLVTTLVRACPDLVVLATSREALGVDGETTWSVPPLGTPPASADSTLVMTYDAVRLFRDRARSVRHDFDVEPGETATLAELVRQLDGMPLAIELAAARVPMMGLAQILRGIDDRFRLLTRFRPGDALGHRSLAASVDWSHDLLSGSEQALLRRLAVFAGSFSLEAAEQVATGDPVDAEDVLDLVARLVAKSMITVDRSDPDEARYRLLETIRAYSWVRLREAGEDQVFRVRHLEWAAALIAIADGERSGHDQARCVDRLEREHDNLRDALEFATTEGRMDVALTMAAGMNLFWKLHGHLGEARGTLGALIDATADDVDQPTRRAAEWAMADICYWMGDIDEAMRRSETVLAESRAAGDRWYEGRTLWVQGNIQSHLHPKRSLDLATRSATIARSTGDVWLEGVAVVHVGLLHRFRCDAEAARSCFDAGFAVSGTNDFPQVEAWCWVGLQRLAIDDGDLAEADRCFEQGMVLAELIRDPATSAWLVLEHAHALEIRGRCSEARDLLARGVAELEASGVRVFAPYLNYRLLVILLGDDQVAAGEIARILELPALASIGQILSVMGRCWLALAAGDLAVVVRSAERTAAIARTAFLPHELTEQLLLLGWALLDADVARAADAFHEALTVGVDVGLRTVIPDALDGIAASDSRRGADADADAARLLAAADGLRRKMGTVRHPVLDRMASAVEAEVSGRLGDGYEVARTEGRQLTEAEAVLHARRNRGRRNRPTTGWASLTPTEEQVVALAAEGLTNAQIAVRLFVGLATVKTHLAHAFAKLAVANRTELAAIVARRSSSGSA